MDIIGKRKIFFIISIIIILVGIASMLIMGMNQDIDFAGGTAIHINIGQQFDNIEIRDIVSKEIGFAPSSIQKAGKGETEVIIKTKPIESAKREDVFNAIKDKYGLEQTDLLSTDNVNPIIGKELKSQAVTATTIAAILMLIYITIRFEFKSGVAAVISLLHNLLIMLTVYAVFQIPINTSFIAAILTILGYSINDTIVVFDKIRENSRLQRKKPFKEITNKSIMQTLTRSINTSITTLLTIGSLYILGVPSIKIFAFPIIIGIISGTYSSIFIASPIWVLLRGSKKRGSIKTA